MLNFIWEYLHVVNFFSSESSENLSAENDKSFSGICADFGSRVSVSMILWAKSIGLGAQPG